MNDTAGGLNAFGQITHDLLGSGIQRERIYDLVTGDLEKITAGPSGNPMLLQNASIGYDDMGNVQQRQNNLGSLPASLTENFAYGDAADQDYRDRLTKVYRDDGNGAVQTLDIDYDAFGNIDYRIDASSAAIPVDMSISWTSYNYPRTISAPSVGESASFAYGPDRQRWRMVYQAGSTSETTYYLGGLMEKVVKAGVAEYRHYIPGAEEIIGLYSRANSGTNVLRYVLTDHQGSIEAITDSAGSNPIYSSFTALGVPRDPIDWSGSPSSTHDAITRQGYTFQTVLGRMGLNHMNGRVHDAISGTFLSPDPFIPDPLNTQAFNRYAYVYNNPMTYTDPSGFSPDDECWGFCWWPPIIPQDILIPPEYRDVVRMCMMGWCPLNYERSLSPDKAAATINPGPDRRGTGKVGSAEGSITVAGGTRTPVYMMSVGYLGGPIFMDVPTEEAAEAQARFMEMNIRTAEATFTVLTMGFGSGEFLAAKETGRQIISRLAREERSKGVEYLRSFLTDAEAKLLNNPRMRDLTIGKAVHYATWARARAEYPKVFQYYTKGMDYVYKKTGEMIELAKRLELHKKAKKYGVGEDSIATY